MWENNLFFLLNNLFWVRQDRQDRFKIFAKIYNTHVYCKNIYTRKNAFFSDTVSTSIEEIIIWEKKKKSITVTDILYV